MKKPASAADRCYSVYDWDGFGPQRCSQEAGHEGPCGTDWEWCDTHNGGDCLR